MKEQKKDPRKLFLGLLICVLIWFYLEFSETGVTPAALFEVIKSIGTVLLVRLSLVVIILSIWGSFILFQKYFPTSKEEYPETEKPHPREFANYQLMAVKLFFLGWPIGGLLSYWILSWLAGLWYRTIPGIYVAAMETVYWAVPSMFLGLLFGCVFASLVLNIKLGKKYALFNKFYDDQMGFNSSKSWKFMVSIYLFLFLGLIYYGLSTYTRFTETGIYIHRSYQFTEEYHRYEEVTNVEELIRVGESSTDHNFIIDFSDGRQWRTSSFKHESIPQNLPQIMGFVCIKSGLEYQRSIGNGK